MVSRKLSTLVSGLVLLMLFACGTPSQPYPAEGAAPAGNTTLVAGYGTVQAIDLVPHESSSGSSMLGTVAGAVVGGIIGHQIGSGTGQTVATVVGSAGGAMAGNAMSNKSQAASQVYRITLRMNDGSVQTLVQESVPSLRVGDRVHIASTGVIERM